MTKRKRFILTSFVLSLGFLGMQLLEDSLRLQLIGILALLTLVMMWWSLREGLRLNMTLVSLFLPVLFTIGIGLF